MALNGALAITVHRIDVQIPAPVDGESPRKHEDHSVKFTIAGQEQHTKYNKSQHDVDVEQTLRFDLKNVQDDEAVLMEINTHNKKKGAPLVANKLPVSNFLSNLKNIVVTFTVEGPKAKTVRVYLSSEWTLQGGATAAATSHAAAASAPLIASPTALTVREVHRPWFARASYYYDTTKHVYAYTTSFRVVASLARFGESSANLVLQKVSGKNLRDLDQQVLVPVLDTLDSKVDATISTVVTKLIEGQQYVLKKKDDAVDTATSVASKGTASISSAVGSTVSGVVKVKDYTTARIATASSSAYSTVVSVKDYTTTQVVSVSSTTYNSAKGATWYVLSHVPILGAKIGA